MAENNGGSVQPLLERAYMFLADGDFDSADNYAEKVLDAQPKNAEAYVCKLLAEYGIKRKAGLRLCGEDFSESPNYRKIYDFGDEKLKSWLSESLQVSLKVGEYADRVEKTEKEIEDRQKEIKTFQDSAGMMSAGQRSINGIISKCRKWAITYFAAFCIMFAGILTMVLNIMNPKADVGAYLGLLLLSLVMMIAAIILMIVSLVKMHAAEEMPFDNFTVFRIVSVLYGVGMIWGLIIAIMQFTKKKVNYGSSANDFNRLAERNKRLIEELTQRLEQEKKELQEFMTAQLNSQLSDREKRELQEYIESRS